MAESSIALEKAKDRAEHVAREVATNRWIEWLARLGYATRGLLYIVVGVMSVLLVFGAGGGTTDKTGAIAVLGEQAYGKALLVLVAIGLVGYSLWGFVRAIADPLGRGTGLKALAERGGYAVSGIVYGALIFPTVRLILGAGSGSVNGETEKWTTAWLLAQPMGQWLVGIAGLVTIIGGLGQAHMAGTAGFMKDFKFSKTNEGEQRTARTVGRIGHAARAVVFTLFGFFLLRAALLTNPDEAEGLDGTLHAILQQRYGPWLLGVVALGLISFGVFSLLCVRWIRCWSPAKKN
jgi:hypothetical protein